MFYDPSVFGRTPSGRIMPDWAAPISIPFWWVINGIKSSIDLDIHVSGNPLLNVTYIPVRTAPFAVSFDHMKPCSSIERHSDNGCCLPYPASIQGTFALPHTSEGYEERYGVPSQSQCSWSMFVILFRHAGSSKTAENSDFYCYFSMVSAILLRPLSEPYFGSEIGKMDRKHGQVTKAVEIRIFRVWFSKYFSTGMLWHLSEIWPPLRISGPK